MSRLDTPQSFQERVKGNEVVSRRDTSPILDKVTVKIIKVDVEQGKIGLSAKL